MRSFDRFRLLKQGTYCDNREFKRWFIQLKRCYPWPEWAVADLCHTDLAKTWGIRNGKHRASKILMGLMGYLIAWRIGAVQTGRDLLEVRKLMATGELEKMVNDFLAAEGKAELKRHLRYARSRGEL